MKGNHTKYVITHANFPPLVVTPVISADTPGTMIVETAKHDFLIVATAWLKPMPKKPRKPKPEKRRA